MLSKPNYLASPVPHIKSKGLRKSSSSLYVEERTSWSWSGASKEGIDGEISNSGLEKMKVEGVGLDWKLSSWPGYTRRELCWWGPALLGKVAGC